MRAVFHLVYLSIGIAAAAHAYCGEPVPVSDVLASPAKFHGQVIHVAGVFWTDGEGARLVDAHAQELDLQRAIEVSFDRKALASDENYRKLKADRLAYIKTRKAEDPKATWIVFQAPVVFEGRVEDALSLPVPAGSEGRRANPYWGCRVKIDLLRIVSYGFKEQKANQPATGQRP